MPDFDRDPTVNAPAGLLDGLPARIVFFDGVCVVCNRSVDWLLQRDVRERFSFAPLQGETARRARAAFPGVIPEGLETIVLLDRSGPVPRIWLRSRALRQILSLLGDGREPWWLRIIPAPIADLGYWLFARVRYALFGRRDVCRIPSPAEALRFLP